MFDAIREISTVARTTGSLLVGQMAILCRRKSFKDPVQIGDERLDSSPLQSW